MTSFLDQIQALPATVAAETAFAQILPAGMFISLPNADKVGFKPSEGSGWKKATKELGGDEVEGYLNPSPRMLVLKTSKLGMFREEDGRKPGTKFLKFIGDFNGDVYYADKKNVILKTRYLVLFVDQDGKALQKTPIVLTLKGAIGAKFSAALLEMRTQAQETLKEMMGKTLNLKSDVFRYLIFVPTIGKYTTDFKSIAAEVKSFEPITLESIESLHGMSYPELKELVNSIMEADPVVEFSTAAPQETSAAVESEDDGFSPRNTKAAPPELVKSLQAMVNLEVDEEEEAADLPY